MAWTSFSHTLRGSASEILPDDLYHWVVEIAGWHGMSAERIATTVLAEQMAQWVRVEVLAAKSSRIGSSQRWTKRRMCSAPENRL
jgi:hypothetical protein